MIEVDAPGPNGSTKDTQTLYYVDGQVQKEIDPDPTDGQDDSGSATTIVTFDDAGDPLTTTVSAPGPSGTTVSRTTTDTYNADGQLTSELGPATGNSAESQSDETFAYDLLGDETSESDVDELSDSGNAPQTQWDTTTTQFDNLGRAWDVKSPAPEGSSQQPDTQTVYDADGDLIQSNVLNPSGQWATTAYTYDGEGNELTEKDPDGDLTSYGTTPTGIKPASPIRTATRPTSPTTTWANWSASRATPTKAARPRRKPW